jgi:hypothetical protein
LIATPIINYNYVHWSQSRVLIFCKFIV